MATSPAVKANWQSVKNNIFQGIFAQNVQPAVWIDDTDRNNPYPRNDKITFKGDPLALVLSFRDQGLENWKITEALTTNSTWDLFAQDVFIVKAEEIKKYYRNKLLVNILKHSDRSLSKFRQDLRNFVESDNPYNVYKNDIPMIVKLPDFYLEDKMMDEMVKDYRMDSKFYENVNGEKILYPLQKHHRKTKNTDQFHYWFRGDDRLVHRISIDPKNPLLHLFEREFAKESVRVAGTFYATKIRGQDYTFYSLTNWKLL